MPVQFVYVLIPLPGLFPLLLAKRLTRTKYPASFGAGM